MAQKASVMRSLSNSMRNGNKYLKDLVHHVPNFIEPKVNSSISQRSIFMKCHSEEIIFYRREIRKRDWREEKWKIVLEKLINVLSIWSLINFLQYLRIVKNVDQWKIFCEVWQKWKNVWCYILDYYSMNIVRTDDIMNDEKYKLILVHLTVFCFFVCLVKYLI